MPNQAHSVIPTLHVQWEGTPPAFFDPENTGGFTGIEVPPKLLQALHALSLRTVQADPDDLEESCKEELRSRFESAALGSPSAPEGTAQLTLFGDPVRTDLMLPERWKPTQGPALAFQVGLKALSADRSVDPAAVAEKLVREHAGGLVKSSYFVCFELVAGGAS